LALQKYGDKLSEQQEVLMHVADMLMDVFAADSAVLRATASAASQMPRASLQVDAARVFVNDAAMRLEASARQALPVMIDGETLKATLGALKRLLTASPINTAALRRGLADEAVARGAYIF